MRSIVALTLLAGLAGPAPAVELADRITPLVKAHKGKVAVAVKHLKTGAEFYHAADEPMPTASLIKFPVMVEAYWQVKEGKLKLDTPLTLRKDDRVPGSGVLSPHFSDGATFPLRDAVRLMIAVSDNTATNMVLERTGIRPVNERMAKLGLTETRLNAQVFRGSTTSVDPDRSKKYGLGSTTAREMVKLLEMLQEQKLVSPEACQEMLAHLRACDNNDMFKRYLPTSVLLAHKIGAVNNARTEAGIMTTPSGPIALCVLTNENDDRRWVVDNAAQVLLANVARAVYDHFNTPPAAPPAKDGGRE
ncbi:MAG TPA: serine hydrolase [Urbifossiella sp.]|jgi:beta-lactamase class A|nr:serine hydrolase [Urbifossiella sp.]